MAVTVVRAPWLAGLLLLVPDLELQQRDKAGNPAAHGEWDVQRPVGAVGAVFTVFHGATYSGLFCKSWGPGGAALVEHRSDESLQNGGGGFELGRTSLPALPPRTAGPRATPGASPSIHVWSLTWPHEVRMEMKRIR